MKAEPCTPNSMEMWLAGAEIICLGMVSGCTELAPLRKARA
jgi:hypothetical protein